MMEWLQLLIPPLATISVVAWFNRPYSARERHRFEKELAPTASTRTNMNFIGRSGNGIEPDESGAIEAQRTNR